MELVIASSNCTKVRELRTILEELFPDLRIRSLLDFPDFQGLEEMKESFEENAIAKAAWAAEQLNRPAVADESGLVIPYLGDEVISLERKKGLDKSKKLPDTKSILTELQNTAESNRVAFLECVLAFAVPEKGCIRSCSARIEGYIAEEEKGPASFDFSSIFIKYDYSKRLAELPESVLARISHRRKACEKLRPSIKEYFS